MMHLLTAFAGTSVSLGLCLLMVGMAWTHNARAADAPAAGGAPAPGPIATGLRVFTCGHSFHATVIPELVSEIAAAAGIKGHVVAGVSMIGGSRAQQHYEIPTAQSPAKTALTVGTIDVLTLSCMERPDEGVANFARLAAAHNPAVRVTLQELWIPEDQWPFDAAHRKNQSRATFDNATVDALTKTAAPYCKLMEDCATTINTELGKPVVFIVPDAQATIKLRAHIIAGTAPSLSKQSDLFTDPWGHPTAPLRLLSAYCHFAVIYRRSPVGLPLPPTAIKDGVKDEALNLLLQQLAWDTVVHHPLSGVTAPVPAALKP